MARGGQIRSLLSFKEKIILLLLIRQRKRQTFFRTSWAFPTSKLLRNLQTNPKPLDFPTLHVSPNDTIFIRFILKFGIVLRDKTNTKYVFLAFELQQSLIVEISVYNQMFTLREC